MSLMFGDTYDNAFLLNYIIVKTSSCQGQPAMNGQKENLREGEKFHKGHTILQWL